MAQLPDNFQFSQSNLQDYVECPRRFELRYIQGLRWPAAEAEPIAEHERHMRQGQVFHHMIHQHQIGIPAATLTPLATDPDLRSWWQNYLDTDLLETLPANREPEVMLSASLGNHRLLAKYDLLAIDNERAVIVDWKTSRRVPSSEKLAQRLQTIVYRYLLVEAGAVFNDGVPINPEQVEMIYWFAAEPNTTVRFSYDSVTHQTAAEYLHGLAAEIEARSVFDLTTDTHKCHFCTYRSLCERGTRAGAFESLDADEDAVTEDFDFDFDQIAEVEF